MENKSKVIYLRITESLHQALLEKARRLHLDLPEVMRRALGESVAEGRTLVDRPGSYQTREPR